MLNKEKAATRGASFSQRNGNTMKKIQKEDQEMLDNPILIRAIGVGIFGCIIVAAVGIARWYGGRKSRSGGRSDVPAPVQQGGTEREELMQRVIDVHRQALQANQLRIYGKLFQDLTLPLQRLLGLAALGSSPEPAWAVPEHLREVLQDDITAEVRGVLRRFGARQEAGMTVLPAQPPAETSEDFLSRVKSASAGQLRQALEQDRAALKESRVWAVQKEIVEGLNWLLEELDRLSRAPRYDPEGVAQTARRVQKVLEQQGVYPMFLRDSRLDECPELREYFGRVSGEQLEYPGLFRRTDGRWERFGVHAGTCGRE